MVAGGYAFKVSIFALSLRLSVNLQPELQYGTYCVDEVGLELVETLLFLLPKCRGYRHVSPSANALCLSGSLLIETRLLKKWGLGPLVSLFKTKIGTTVSRHLESSYSGPKE